MTHVTNLITDNAGLQTLISTPTMKRSFQKAKFERYVSRLYSALENMLMGWGQFHLVVGNHRIAPDGYEVDRLLFNGTYPGPTLEGNWGDTFGES